MNFIFSRFAFILMAVKCERAYLDAYIEVHVKESQVDRINSAYSATKSFIAEVSPWNIAIPSISLKGKQACTCLLSVLVSCEPTLHLQLILVTRLGDENTCSCALKLQQDCTSIGKCKNSGKW